MLVCVFELSLQEQHRSSKFVNNGSVSQQHQDDGVVPQKRLSAERKKKKKVLSFSRGQKKLPITNNRTVLKRYLCECPKRIGLIIMWNAE